MSGAMNVSSKRSSRIVRDDDDWSDTLSAWSLWSRGSQALQGKAANDLSREHADMPSLEVARSQRPQSETERLDMHHPLSGRKSVPSKTEVRDRISTALKAVPSAKHVVRGFAEDAADLPSVDTAEGWRGGLNIPGGYNLIVLARQFPEVRAVVRQLIDSEFDQDPRAYAMFVEAMRYAQGRVK